MKIISLLLFAFIRNVSSEMLVIIPDNTLINTNTSYNVSVLYRDTTIDSLGYITFTFPSNVYSLSQLTNLNCTPTCTQSGYTIQIINSLFSSPYTELDFRINNIVNPSSLMTPQGYIYSMYNSANSMVETQTTSLAFTAGSLNCILIINFRLLS
jgi:hypothetical protein